MEYRPRPFREICSALMFGTALFCFSPASAQNSTITFVKDVVSTLPPGDPADWSFYIVALEMEVAHGESRSLAPGSYLIEEHGPSGYSVTSASGVCSLVGHANDIVLEVPDRGGSYDCVVTNTQITADITFVKEVDYDAEEPSLWTFEIVGVLSNIPHGSTVTLGIGDYDVIEHGPPEYPLGYARESCHFQPWYDAIALSVTEQGGQCVVHNRLTCVTHCDCPQASFCYYGTCRNDPRMPVFCCDQEGCPPGNWCVDSEGTKSMCPESFDYSCSNACDCGPAHACMDVEGYGTLCVKDQNDPWWPGPGLGDGPSVPVPDLEPTYCCAKPQCFAGRLAYGGAEDLFRCYDFVTDSGSNTCGADVCYSPRDCNSGQTCVEPEPDESVPNVLCSRFGGRCVSNAVAESLFNFKPSDLAPPCVAGAPTGMKCVAGWRPGGRVSYEAILVPASSCGDGTCGGNEFPDTCPNDCFCGDGKCDPAEAHSCSTDCGDCGDLLCNGLETPKTCPGDCPIACGDGSCHPDEIDGEFPCPADCWLCPTAVDLYDIPAACGDGICQAGEMGYVERGNFPLETEENCPVDCRYELDLRVFLEGAHEGRFLMSTDLAADLPELQPFADPPWSFGSHMLRIPHPDNVDWLLLEMRSGTEASERFSRQPALLNKDGYVVDAVNRGKPRVPRTGYLVVRSRNHLDVMSAGELPCTETEPGSGWQCSWDFSSGNAYGTDALKSLPGVYAMWAGDCDSDGIIDPSDAYCYLGQTTLGWSGYHSADFNLDGRIQALDFNLYIANELEGPTSQVP